MVDSAVVLNDKGWGKKELDNPLKDFFLSVIHFRPVYGSPFIYTKYLFETS